MRPSTVSARLDVQTDEKLDKLAKATSQTRSFLISEAIHSYIEEHLWQIEAIEEGIREADAGNFADEEKVKKAFARLGVNVR